MQLFSWMMLVLTLALCDSKDENHDQPHEHITQLAKVQAKEPAKQEPKKEPEKHFAIRRVNCFVDTGSTSSTRILDKLEEKSWADMTIKKCVDRCKKDRKQGYMLAGVSAGNECLCGTHIKASQITEKCNVKCSGHATELCGGASATMVYMFQKKGCPFFKLVHKREKKKSKCENKETVELAKDKCFKVASAKGEVNVVNYVEGGDVCDLLTCGGTKRSDLMLHHTINPINVYVKDCDLMLDPPKHDSKNAAEAKKEAPPVAKEAKEKAANTSATTNAIKKLLDGPKQKKYIKLGLLGGVVVGMVLALGWSLWQHVSRLKAAEEARLDDPDSRPLLATGSPHGSAPSISSRAIIK